MPSGVRDLSTSQHTTSPSTLEALVFGPDGITSFASRQLNNRIWYLTVPQSQIRQGLFSVASRRMWRTDARTWIAAPPTRHRNYPHEISFLKQHWVARIIVIGVNINCKENLNHKGIDSSFTIARMNVSAPKVRIQELLELRWEDIHVPPWNLLLKRFPWWLQIERATLHEYNIAWFHQTLFLLIYYSKLLHNASDSTG